MIWCLLKPASVLDKNGAICTKSLEEQWPLQTIKNLSVVIHHSLKWLCFHAL